MIIYIKQYEKNNILYKIFTIFKIKQIDNRTTIFVPINKKSRKRRTEKVMQKLSKYFYNNAIKNVVLENSLMENEIAKNVLYSNNINILDGSKLEKLLVFNVIQKVYKYKNKPIETGEITILANDNNDINVKTIIKIAEKIKKLNIITNNTKKFKKLIDSLYEEWGILIKLSNNFKTNLSSSDIIVNMDFTEKNINKLTIPSDAIIINVPENININSKKFSGINIKNWEIEAPEKYNIKDFSTKINYEAIIYTMTATRAFEQIKNDNIKIKKLIGVNGAINKKEFISQKK